MDSEYTILVRMQKGAYYYWRNDLHLLLWLNTLGSEPAQK